MQEPVLDLRRAAGNFSAAASRYERGAQLQQDVRTQLLQQLPILAAPQRILDLGCGTGLGARALQARWPQAQVLGLDLAEGMLRQARAAGLTLGLRADAQSLPLADQSFDLLFANLSLQWCPQLPAAWAEARRVLRPGGRLLCSLPGPGTLRELRLAWRQVDEAEHVHRFASLEVLLAQARDAGLLCLDSQARQHRYWHPDVRQLMASLREIGVGNVSSGRRRGLFSRQGLQQLEQAYAPWRQAEGLRASWDILYLELSRPECAR